jgi:hypothetical protein
MVFFSKNKVAVVINVVVDVFLKHKFKSKPQRARRFSQRTQREKKVK